jgi:hypothetical protein
LPGKRRSTPSNAAAAFLYFSAALSKTLVAAGICAPSGSSPRSGVSITSSAPAKAASASRTWRWRQ